MGSPRTREQNTLITVYETGTTEKRLRIAIVVLNNISNAYTDNKCLCLDAAITGSHDNIEI